MARQKLKRDNAGVIAPPPLLALAAVVFGLLLDGLFPAFVLTVLLDFNERLAIGIVLMAAGLALVAAANLSFRKAGTNPEPWKPATAIVATGVFAWLRNPMYVGGTVLLIGLAILVASDWMVVTTIVMAVILHFGVVRREERYLEAKFGDAYRDYCARVSRYGWPG
ncbi:MAG TPA: isoprenylcysteine carboxylmethyltransferase family protein [Pseudolabrys sp.]|jgi:protein-S-isoprenylcysteine O-methyltransferase Ste14|nr:isoprenylcysteine carboxylmethyltransferase family protein [Pseudolabrys sp.]